ncbi:MAG: thermonuclease family protein [Syntrophobacterales bacterium]|nr:thermonuclease family protein [Syntrophobacterales bacterium]
MSKEVTVVAQKKDRYGRTLGYVILPDGRNLNRELVQAGYAWWYRQFSSDSSLGSWQPRPGQLGAACGGTRIRCRPGNLERPDRGTICFG